MKHRIGCWDLAPKENRRNCWRELGLSAGEVQRRFDVQHGAGYADFGVSLLTRLCSGL
jgi:hypothetical protein